MSNYASTPDLYQPWAYPDYAYHNASADDAQDPAYLSPTSAYHCQSPVDAQSLAAYNPYFADSVYGSDPYGEHSARNVSSYESTPACAPASLYSSTSNSPRLRPQLSRGFSDYRHGYALSQHDAHAPPYDFIDYNLPQQTPGPRIGMFFVFWCKSCPPSHLVRSRPSSASAQWGPGGKQSCGSWLLLFLSFPVFLKSTRSLMKLPAPLSAAIVACTQCVANRTLDRRTDSS